MNLTAENVNKILLDCLFNDEEIKACNGKPEKFVKAEGVMMNVGFHPERLESHRAEVSSMLSELPPEFMHDNPSGGWSFLNACVTKSGKQWGEHRNVDELLLLGYGLNMVKYLLPREAWKILPGGVPYFTVNVNGFPKEEPAKQD